VTSSGERIETYWIDKYADAALAKLTAFYARTTYSPSANKPNWR
jgi:hypothetical protein